MIAPRPAKVSQRHESPMRASQPMQPPIPILSAVTSTQLAVAARTYPALARITQWHHAQHVVFAEPKPQTLAVPPLVPGRPLLSPLVVPNGDAHAPLPVALEPRCVVFSSRPRHVLALPPRLCRCEQAETRAECERQQGQSTTRAPQQCSSHERCVHADRFAMHFDRTIGILHAKVSNGLTHYPQVPKKSTNEQPTNKQSPPNLFNSQ